MSGSGDNFEGLHHSFDGCIGPAIRTNQSADCEEDRRFMTRTLITVMKTPTASMTHIMLSIGTWWIYVAIRKYADSAANDKPITRHASPRIFQFGFLTMMLSPFTNTR